MNRGSQILGKCKYVQINLRNDILTFRDIYVLKVIEITMYDYLNMKAVLSKKIREIIKSLNKVRLWQSLLAGLLVLLLLYPYPGATQENPSKKTLQVATKVKIRLKLSAQYSKKKITVLFYQIIVLTVGKLTVRC